MYDQQYREMKDKIDQLDDKIYDIYQQIEEQKKQIRFKGEKEQELNQKILAINYDIQDAQQIIDEIEKKIAENNIRLEKLKAFKTKEEQRLQQLLANSQ